MLIPDIVNAVFEFGAAFAVLNHCRAVWKVRYAAGVSVVSTIFFTMWGVWNLYYYPVIGQVWSAIAGVAVLLANLLWIALLVKFRNKT